MFLLGMVQATAVLAYLRDTEAKVGGKDVPRAPLHSCSAAAGLVCTTSSICASSHFALSLSIS